MENFIPDNAFTPDAAPKDLSSKADNSDFVPDSQFKPDDYQSQADQAQQQDEALQGKYGTPGQHGIAALEAVGQGLAGPLSPMAEKALGVNPEDIRGREEANPITHSLGETVGLLSPVGEGALLAKIGRIAGKGIVGKGILAGMKRSAVKIAAESAVFQSGDEISKVIKEDPNQSVGSAIAYVGLAGALGGAGGAVIGAVSPLWKATVGNKASQFLADFKGRMQEHINDPNPVDTFTKELTDYHTGITSLADDVYGPTGLKAQEIAKLMPEASPKISQQMEELSTKAQDTIRKMSDQGVPERYVSKVTKDLDTFQDAITRPQASPGDVFNAAQDFKQTLQGYSKGNFGPFAVPSYHEAYDFLKLTKELGHDVRQSLEDPSVWGKAANRQQAINKAFSEYKPALDDFNKKFTSELNGERVIDPGKANTYFNQLGKPNAELKKQMLANFVNASEKYKQVISDSHANLGLDSPIPPSSLNAITGTFKDLSAGSKLADVFVKKVADKLGGSVLGGAIGHMTGIPFGEMGGAYLGEKFLGSILPAIVKPILDKSVSAEGLSAASSYSESVIRGTKLINSASKAVFERGKIPVPENKQPNAESRAKLSSSIEKLSQDPERLNTPSNIGHYLPDHAVAMAGTLSSAVQFLNSVKPNPQPKTMLDKPRPVSQAAQAQYDRALDIAQQPLIVVDAIKKGTLTSHDVIAIQKLYPSVYKQLQQQITSEMVQHVSKGESVPYDTRLSLSLFLHNPLDSTILPMAILQAQPSPQPAPQASIGPKKGSPSKLKGESSKMAMTGDQNAEAISSGAKKP